MQVTVAVPSVFPPGTTLSVYPDPVGDLPPSGPVVTTAVVAANSTATFTGLASKLTYQAGALVGGVWRGFLLPDIGDPGTTARAWFGNATESEYASSPTQFQVVEYFGQDGPVSGLLPQAALTRLKAFDRFTDDSIQANASQAIFTNLGTPKTSVTPLVANESDAIIQAGNKALGYGARLVPHIDGAEAQGSGSEADFAYAHSIAAKSARDIGSIIRQHAAYHSEDQLSGIAGKVGAAWSMFVPRAVHSRDSFSVADYSGVEGHMSAASIVGATSVTLETGHGAGGFRGSGPFAAAQVVQIDVGTNAEVRTIATSGVSGDTLTFTAALSKAHGQYCRVAVLGANGYGMLYMLSGNLKTDSVLVASGFQAINYVVTAANGAGFFQMQQQSGGAVGTPSAGTVRIYLGSTKVMSVKGEDGIEAPVTTGHRVVTATNLTLTALHGGIVAVTDTTAARTITLPAANGVPAGWTVVVKDESGAAGTNNITVQRAGADDIEGVATKVINTNYGLLRLYSGGGARWFLA